MKKSLFVAAIAAISLVACKKGEATNGTDSLDAKADSATEQIDSTANVAKDSISKVADSATKAIDSTAKAAEPAKH